MAKPGANDPCPCGSGKKYKRCCRSAPSQRARSQPAPSAVSSAFENACAQHRAGRLDLAAALYGQVLEQQPRHADALHMLGMLKRQQGRRSESIELLRRATTLSPDNALVHNNMAIVLKESGDFAGAVAAYRRAIALQPGFAGAHYNLGLALQAQGQPGEALASLQQAVALQPDYAEAHNELGIILIGLGRVDESIACIRRALACQPGFAMAHSNLLSVMQYRSALACADLRSALRGYAERFEAPLRAGWAAHSNSREAERRLKIGYVSADFRHHSVAYFIEPILARHDKRQVEVFCYYNHTWRDEFTARLAGHADHWLDCKSWSDDQLAARIRADGIDILVDLSGHTADNRLLVFARKPAPLQVTYLGYPGSTGLAAMDYRITDADLDPPGMTEAWHTEDLWRVSNFAPFRPSADSPEVASLPALESGNITFACFNALAKINGEVAALWARILAAQPGSRLMLGNVGNAVARQWLGDMLSGAGIPVEQLIFKPPMPLPAYLSIHSEIDLALDPFPWNGNTSSQHSLWLGVPVITLAGTRTAGRLGVTTLRNVGLAEFVAESEDDYVAIALRWARDLPGLSAIRQEMRRRIATHPESDPARVASEIEEAYRGMWRRWCAT
jgi:predicted O-linked N-acetylglucosamine transferase (SPINDLY family)